MNQFDKILVEPLKQIDLSDGNVLHALKKRGLKMPVC